MTCCLAKTTGKSVCVLNDHTRNACHHREERDVINRTNEDFGLSLIKDIHGAALTLSDGTSFVKNEKRKLERE